MKLVTWNIQWARGMDGRVSSERIARRAAQLADFDVLCLQEVAVNFGTLEGSSGEDQVAQLHAALPACTLHFAPATDIDDGRGGRSLFGNLIASKLPVAQVLRHQLPWPADRSSPSMARTALEAVIESPFGWVRVVTTHLEYYSPTIRMAQVNALRLIHSEACAQATAPRKSGARGDPFRAQPRPATGIVCGDFNFRPDSAEYSRLTAPFDDGALPLRDAWTAAHPCASHPPTFRLHETEVHEAPYCCDFVFVTEDLVPRVRKVKIDETTQASDHQPVLVELTD